MTGDVYPQPGVFRLHFRRQVGGDTVVAYTGSQRASRWYVEGAPPVSVEPHLRLHFDLIPFGPTRLYVRSARDTTLVVDSVEFSTTGRYRGDVMLDLQPVLAPGGLPARKDTLFWEIKTAEINNWSVYHPMLKSDYRGPFATRPEIASNAFYQTFFKNGNPLRQPGEDPLQDPVHYWPYVLPVEPRIASPGNVGVQADASGLTLSWQDRSSLETRYMLKVQAISWNGDTLESAKYLTGTNGTSAFVAWNDPFWDFIPAGTALQKIVVGVYAARDTVINGDSVRFFSDVVWAETLRPAPPSLVSVTVVADSGIRS